MDAQTDTIFEDAVHSAYAPVDEALSRIAMLNSLLSAGDSLRLEGVGYKGFMEALYDVEASLTSAVRVLEPAFEATSTCRRWTRPAPSAKQGRTGTASTAGAD